MDRVYALCTQLASLRLSDDDLIDRLHRVYTAFGLSLVSIVIAGKQNGGCDYHTSFQYFGEPMFCWMNEKQMILGHQKYADTVCWISNTYYVPYKDSVPQDVEERRQLESAYYQWVPLILLFQAFLFYIPCLIWRTFSNFSGVNIETVVNICVDCKNLNLETRKKTFRNVAKYLNYTLSSYRDNNQSRCGELMRSLSRLYVVCGRSYGNVITMLYFLVKVLYVCNAAMQVYMIDFYLRPVGQNTGFFGIQLVKDFFSEHSWLESGRFPRVTLCDFVIRAMGNIHTHTVQCLLPINMFNEKVYIFLWFWMTSLTLLTIFSFFAWVAAIAFHSARADFLTTTLNMRRVLAKDSAPAFRYFLADVLRSDGIFVLRMVACNSSNLTAQDLAAAMFDLYKEEYAAATSNGAVRSVQSQVSLDGAPVKRNPYQDSPV